MIIIVEKKITCAENLQCNNLHQFSIELRHPAEVTCNAMLTIIYICYLFMFEEYFMELSFIDYQKHIESILTSI